MITALKHAAQEHLIIINECNAYHAAKIVEFAFYQINVLNVNPISPYLIKNAKRWQWNVIKTYINIAIIALKTVLLALLPQIRVINAKMCAKLANICINKIFVYKNVQLNTEAN